MIALALRGVSLAGVGILIVDSSTLALWGVVVTGALSLIKSELDKRDARRAREQQHEFEKQDRAEERREAARIRASIDNKLALNLTAVNHVNEKIAGIAQAALSVGVARQATLNQATAEIRADIAEVRVHQ